MEVALAFLLGVQIVLMAIIALSVRDAIVMAQRHHDELIAHRQTKFELAVAKGVIESRSLKFRRVKSM